jgi:16S rRNA processing protein RimM
MANRPERTAVATPAGHVCLCVIGPAHGVHGAVKVKSFAENIADLAAYGPLHNGQGQSFKITSVKPDKIGARITLHGVTHRDAAEALRGTPLFVAREKLPVLQDEDGFYHADLIGITVRDAQGADMGRVAGVHNFGAGDLLEISAGKESGFYPFTKAVVPQIDIAAGYLTLVPPQEDEARPPQQTGEQTSEQAGEQEEAGE